MKMRYRIAILATVFLVSCILFYRRVETHTYQDEQTTLTAAAAKLPVISFRVSGVEINPTLGYTFQMDAGMLRESITPLTEDGAIDILIDQKENDIRKLVLTISETASGKVLEQKEIKALKTAEDGRRYAAVILEGNYAAGREYCMEITLVTSESREIYFYTRMLAGYGEKLPEELEFAQFIHDSALSYTDRTALQEYLETSDTQTGNDYSHVTIEDSVETVGYGEMKPEQLYQQTPTITEYGEVYVSLKFEFWLKIYDDETDNVYRAAEEMRVYVKGKKKTLYNYDRYLNCVFTGNTVSIAKNQIKLGLTTQTTPNYLLSSNEKYLLYVQDGDLWEYDMLENQMHKVFSFDLPNGDYERYQNQKHDYKLLTVDDEGNADYLLFGYITRGEYEGRVGILYYRYYAKEHRNEEMMFVPVNTSYEILKEEFGSVLYRNDYDELYFSIGETLYLYQTLVHQFSVVANTLSANHVLFEEKNMLIYQDQVDSAANEKVIYYDLENRAAKTIAAPEGDRILLLGNIDNQLIYGLAHAADISFADNGETIVPMYRLVIEELDGTIVKVYEREGEYFTEAEINDNAITMKLCRKAAEVSYVTETGEQAVHIVYEDTGDYNILKSMRQKTEKIKVVYRTTDRMHREYYLTLPESISVKKIPTVAESIFTVITANTTAHMEQMGYHHYYVSAYGNILMATDQLGEAIAKADAVCGSVMDTRGNLLFRRGTKKSSHTIVGFRKTYASETLSAQQAILQMYADYKGSGVSGANCNLNEKAFLSWITETVPGTGVELTGASLSEVLSFVSDGRPVCAYYDEEWVLIIAYSDTTITMIRPDKGKTYFVNRTEAAKELDHDGIFYSYID